MKKFVQVSAYTNWAVSQGTTTRDIQKLLIGTEWGLLVVDDAKYAIFCEEAFDLCGLIGCHVQHLDAAVTDRDGDVYNQTLITKEGVCFHIDGVVYSPLNGVRSHIHPIIGKLVQDAYYEVDMRKNQIVAHIQADGVWYSVIWERNKGGSGRLYHLYKYTSPVACLPATTPLAEPATTELIAVDNRYTLMQCGIKKCFENADEETMHRQHAVIEAILRDKKPIMVL